MLRSPVHEVYRSIKSKAELSSFVEPFSALHDGNEYELWEHSVVQYYHQPSASRKDQVMLYRQLRDGCIMLYAARRSVYDPRRPSVLGHLLHPWLDMAILSPISSHLGHRTACDWR